MLSRIIGPALIAWLTCCLAACAPIRFERQELALRHDAQADTLDLLILYDAIQTNDKDDLSKSSGFATRVCGGKRELMIFDWPLHFDLDDLEYKMAQQAEEPEQDLGPWGDWQRELVKSLKSLSVRNSGYFRDETARLGLQQRLHVADATHWIALFERALYIGIEDSLAKGTFESDFHLLDEPSRALWIKLAHEKQPWLSLRDGVLSVDLPLSGACAGRLLAELMKRSTLDPGWAGLGAGLCSSIESLTIANDRIIVRWKFPGMLFEFPPKADAVYDDSLAQSLRDSDALPEKLPSRAAVLDGFLKH